MSRCILGVLVLLCASASAFEFNHAADGTPIRWNAALPIRWSVPEGTPDNVRSTFVAALAQWSEASGGALNFVEASGGITLNFNPDSKLGTAMAYTTCEVQSGQILRANIEVNAHDYNWTSTYALFLAPALLHELGHALGLGHPKSADSITGSYLAEDPPTMWETLTLNARTLHYDDILGLRTLYGLDTTFPNTFTCSEKHRGKVYTFTASAAPADVYWNYGDGTSDAGGTHRFPRGGYTMQAESRGFTGSLFIQIGPVKAAAQRVPHRK